MVAPPLVLHAALVVSAVRLRWFLGQKRIGQKARTRFLLGLQTATCSIYYQPSMVSRAWTKEGKEDRDLIGLEDISLSDIQYS